VLSGPSTTRLVSAYGAPAPLFHLGAGALAVTTSWIDPSRSWSLPAPGWAAAPPGCARRIRICPGAEGPSAARHEPHRYGEGPEAPDPGRVPAQNRARDRRPDVAGLAPSRPTRSGGWPNSSSGCDPQHCGPSSPPTSSSTHPRRSQAGGPGLRRSRGLTITQPFWGFTTCGSSRRGCVWARRWGPGRLAVLQAGE